MAIQCTGQPLLRPGNLHRNTVLTHLLSVAMPREMSARAVCFSAMRCFFLPSFFCGDYHTFFTAKDVSHGGVWRVGWGELPRVYVWVCGQLQVFPPLALPFLAPRPLARRTSSRARPPWNVRKYQLKYAAHNPKNSRHYPRTFLSGPLNWSQYSCEEPTEPCH